MAMISGTITSTVVMFTVAIIPTFVMCKTKIIRANIKENGKKYIDYSDLFFWIIYGVGAFFSVLGLLAYSFSDEPIAGVASLVIGLIFVLFGIVIHAIDTTVTWTSEYISGAKSGSNFKKNTLHWDEIVFVKTLPNKTFQLEDKRGKSVYWSVYQA